MKRSDMDMIAQDMVCIAERADGNGKVEGYYFCLHHNDGRKHLHHLIIPLEVDLSRGTPLDQIQVEVTPESVTLKEQESRVMTLEEVKAIPYDADIWIETEYYVGKITIFAATINTKGLRGVMVYGSHKTYDYEAYNKLWRCWTSRPTNEQREAAKWDK